MPDGGEVVKSVVATLRREDGRGPRDAYFAVMPYTVPEYGELVKSAVVP